MEGGAWWAAVHGVVKSQTQLSDFTFTFHFHELEKEVLAWRIPGTAEPGVLLSMGLHRVGHDWSDLAAAAASFGVSDYIAIADQSTMLNVWVAAAQWKLNLVLLERLFKTEDPWTSFCWRFMETSSTPFLSAMDFPPCFRKGKSPLDGTEAWWL